MGWCSRRRPFWGAREVPCMGEQEIPWRIEAPEPVPRDLFGEQMEAS
jgi:hypothetical protein